MFQWSSPSWIPIAWETASCSEINMQLSGYGSDIQGVFPNMVWQKSVCSYWDWWDLQPRGSVWHNLFSRVGGIHSGRYSDYICAVGWGRCWILRLLKDTQWYHQLRSWLMVLGPSYIVLFAQGQFAQVRKLEALLGNQEVMFHSHQFYPLSLYQCWQRIH